MFPFGSMHPTVVVASTALICAVLTSSATAEPGPDPSGVWLNEPGTSKIRIARCGSGYCGTILSTGGSGIDGNNPDPALKGRKLAGVQILEATTPNGTGFEGSLYNPNDGKTYSGSLTPKGADKLEVSGCVLRVICKSQIWTRTK